MEEFGHQFEQMDESSNDSHQNQEELHQNDHHPRNMDPSDMNENTNDDSMDKSDDQDLSMEEVFNKLTSNISNELALLNEEITDMMVRCQLLETDLVLQVNPYMMEATENSVQAYMDCEHVMQKTFQE